MTVHEPSRRQAAPPSNKFCANDISGTGNVSRSDATRVLVVDDEPSIRQLVATVLRYEGFVVETAATGRAALVQVQRFDPQLVVLDVMLPDIDGREVLRRLHMSSSHLPVIFLSALDGVDDRVQGLTSGGDDYLVKPFSIDELVARVRSVLRRYSAQPPSSLLMLADLTLNIETYDVCRGGIAIELTATEFNLLRYFLQNPRRVLSKMQILQCVWGLDSDIGVVECYVSYLRRKIDSGRSPLLHTVRGVGYCLKPTPLTV